MGDIKVSVCMITYMHENYIRQSLDSVFMQKTNFDFEVIVSEDASPDNTRAILLEYKEKYGDKLVLNLQEENVGVSKNSMSGKQLARGKYIAALEGDDYWTDPYKLQKQYDILENNPQYSAVGHDFMSILSDGTVRRKSVLNMHSDEVKSMNNYMKEGYSIHTCTLFYRNILPNHDQKYIDLRLSAPTMGDIVTMTLLYDAGDIYVMKDVMAAHRIAGDSDTSSYSYKQRTQAIKYTYMFIDRHKTLDVYLNHKYDFSPRIANRVASVKRRKLLRQAEYDRKEMKQLMKTLDGKTRFMVYVRLIKMLFKTVIDKLR